jgi:hypothetical protein
MIASRGFDQCHSWLQQTAAFGVIDNGQGDAVLDAASRIEELTFPKDRDRKTCGSRLSRTSGVLPIRSRMDG